MNTDELVTAVAIEAGCSKATAKNVLNSLVRVCRQACIERKPVKLVGFFKLTTKEQVAKVARLPVTGELRHVDAKVVPRLRLSTTFKDYVAEHDKSTAMGESIT